MPSAVNDFEIEPSRERHNGNNNTDRAYRQRTTAPAPVHLSVLIITIKFQGRTLRGGGRSRQDGCAFCSRLTRRVAFRGCIALVPMAITGAKLPSLITG